jgi:2-polyprenyl-3-methyl-5-hydroxy-6-metoxy-1,4-benzoquinol methylase
MTRSHLDYYAELAATVSDPTRAAGRYAVQRDAERLILRDVLTKLRPRPTDEVIDVGCGVGSLLIPLSFFVHRIVGIDHPDVIARVRTRASPETVELIGGDFLDVDIAGPFDRILIYGVVPALPDESTVLRFVDKALELLRPDGRMLIGDINNRDKKRRFQRSRHGQAFEEAWKKQMAGEPGTEVVLASQPSVDVTDELVARLFLHIRMKGWHAYVLEQPVDLPFGRTREDILVVGPEHVGPSLLTID